MTLQTALLLISGFTTGWIFYWLVKQIANVLNSIASYNYNEYNGEQARKLREAYESKPSTGSDRRDTKEAR